LHFKKNTAHWIRTLTTKPPSQVVPASDTALERIAYTAAKEIPTAEPHDQDRLGYCLWLWLLHRRDSLETAVRNAGARLQVDESEAITRIRRKLEEQGVSLR